MRGWKPRHEKLSVLLLAAASLACAPAPRMGEAVDIAEESAIIIWDEAAKTQHFIRRASFRTTAKDFGFLVPTPTIPELAEADDKAFGHLEKLTAPKVVVRTIPANAKSAPATLSAPAPAAVAVVAQAKVAGYDAVVLEASDAVALNNWLKEHDYASTPELVEWFKPYLERKWKISAFKIDRDSQRSNVAESAAVRMSFKADAPFFPYREPAGNAGRSEPRMLRTYVLATSRMDGVLGATSAWPGRAVWSDRIEEQARATLFGQMKLPATVAAGALWLTEFEDGSSPRPGHDDIFFRVAADQSVLHRPDVIEYVHGPDHIGNALMIVLIIGLLYALWKPFVFLIRKLRS
jgi:hypothetical protein